MIANYKETKTIFPKGDSDDHLMYYLMYGTSGLSFCKKMVTVPSDCIDRYNYSTVKSACAVSLESLTYAHA